MTTDHLYESSTRRTFLKTVGLTAVSADLVAITAAKIVKGTLVALAWTIFAFGVANGDDIPNGRLGHRLGTYLIVEGIGAESGKGLPLRVDTVNGEKLDRPIDVPVENLNLPKATRIRLRGYESGRMVGVPNDPENADRPKPQAGWQFYRYFVVTSVIEPKSLKIELEQTNKHSVLSRAR